MLMFCARPHSCLKSFLSGADTATTCTSKSKNVARLHDWGVCAQHYVCQAMDNLLTRQGAWLPVLAGPVHASCLLACAMSEVRAAVQTHAAASGLSLLWKWRG